MQDEWFVVRKSILVSGQVDGDVKHSRLAK